MLAHTNCLYHHKLPYLKT